MPKYNVNHIPGGLKVHIKNRFALLNLIAQEPEELRTETRNVLEEEREKNNARREEGREIKRDDSRNTGNCWRRAGGKSRRRPCGVGIPRAAFQGPPWIGEGNDSTSAREAIGERKGKTRSPPEDSRSKGEIQTLVRRAEQQGAACYQNGGKWREGGNSISRILQKEQRDDRCLWRTFL